MGVSRDHAARIATFILMALAYLACEIASYPDGNMRPFGVGFGVSLFAMSVLGGYFVPTPKVGQSRPPKKWAFGFAFLLVLPVFVEPLLRIGTGQGFPLELQLVNGLRIFGLMLCGVSAWPVCRRTAGIIALFLALFSSAMGDQPQIPYVLVPFGLVGGIWLILSYRAEQSTAADAMADGLVTRVRLRLPYRESIVFGILAAMAVSIAVAGPKRILLTLGELVPTSGGTGRTDPFARFGVGDGPEEVAGENARAAGMVDTDKMIEDNRNSLIDAVNDMYGPPHRPNRDQERMVAAGLTEVIQNHGKIPDNRRPSRDFDTSRKGPKSDKTPDSQGARGILEVEGRTPLHIRLVTYDRYLAEEKRWEEGRKPSNRMFETEGGDWMVLTPLRSSDWYGPDDRHRIKVAKLGDNLVPTPSLLTRFRINKVDKPDYYEWDYEGVLALCGRKKTPPGVVVTTESHTFDSTILNEDSFAIHSAMVHFEVPNLLRRDIERIARDWAGAHPRGWRQINAILSRLRTRYELDPTSAPPSDHASPVLWFLTESHRGPDYLFATSAALLLRSLGYPTRISLGYYASPEAYDSETDHTPVRKSDLHVWPELLLRDNQWLVVEPTPGYRTLPRLTSWREWFSEKAIPVIVWAQHHRVGLVFVLILTAVLIVKRRSVIDRILTASFILSPGQTWQQRSLRAMQLLDRRARLAHRPREVHSTLANWGQQFSGSSELNEFIRLVEWAAYAPNLTPPVSESSVAVVCRQVIRQWPLSRFQLAFSKVAQS